MSGSGPLPPRFTGGDVPLPGRLGSWHPVKSPAD